MHDDLIMAAALIGVLGVGAQWLAWRVQWPAIVLMSLAGLTVGPIWAAIFGEPLLAPSLVFGGDSDGHGGHGGSLLGPIVSLAVAVILFEGGLNLKFHELRESGAAVRRLILLGTPIAWVLGSLVCHYIAGLGWPTAILFAGILVVTGPTVIMPLLRQSKLGGKVGSTLKWEGIVNDPVGALLAVFVYEVIKVINAGGDGSPVMAGVKIFMAALMGALLGIAFGLFIAQSFKRGWIPEYLKAPFLMATVIFCYALAESIEHETGLVAVTAYGMTLANSKLASLSEVRRFKESIAVMLISAVFVILTADLTPMDIASAFNLPTLGFLICMLFIVRPLSAGLATYGPLSWKEALLVGWIAPRGIVAVAISGFFAERMLAEGHPDAARLTTLAFAMAITTVVLHGFTMGPLARKLGLARKGKPGVLVVGATPWGIGLATCLRDAGVETMIADNNFGRLRGARQANIDRFYGEVMSEEAELKLDHARFDTVLAVTANDPYNALVCSYFAPELGRHKVFQLSASDNESADQREISHSSRGRTLVKRGRTYDALTRDSYRGWTFSKTELTSEYTLDNLQADRPDSDLIAELRADGSLVMLGPSRDPKGGEGAVLISFGPPMRSTDEKAAARTQDA